MTDRIARAIAFLCDGRRLLEDEARETHNQILTDASEDLTAILVALEGLEPLAPDEFLKIITRSE